MLDIERDEPKLQEVKFDGYSCELVQDTTGLWSFLKGNRKELPQELSGKYTSLRNASVTFKNYVLNLKSYVPGRKSKVKEDG